MITSLSRQSPVGKTQLILLFIQILICFVFLSMPIVRLYRVLLISCFNGFFRDFKFINLKLFFGDNFLSN